MGGGGGAARLSPFPDTVCGRKEQSWVNGRLSVCLPCLLTTTTSTALLQELHELPCYGTSAKNPVLGVCEDDSRECFYYSIPQTLTPLFRM